MAGSDAGSSFPVTRLLPLVLVVRVTAPGCGASPVIIRWQLKSERNSRRSLSPLHDLIGAIIGLGGDRALGVGMKSLHTGAVWAKGGFVSRFVR